MKPAMMFYGPDLTLMVSPFVCHMPMIDSVLLISAIFLSESIMMSFPPFSLNMARLPQ